MFYIRADGNPKIGMGHMMRCLSIADAAYALTAIKPVFLLADHTCRRMVEDRGFEAKVLNTDFRDMESEQTVLSDLLHAEDVVLADSYQVTDTYLKDLRKLCRVACMDDMGHPYPADLLINYNIYGPDLKKVYDSASPDENRPSRFLLGTEYMPLREQFRYDRDYNVRDRVTEVLITTGSSDPLFAAGKILDGILESDFLCRNPICCHVVSGPFNQFSEELKSKYGSSDNIIIHENVENMNVLMKCADVVITAAGSTVYEVSSLGIPMIVFYFAENQRQGAEALERLTDIVNAGCFAECSETVIERVSKTLEKCVRDKAYRELLNRQERRLVDGKGAERIAEAIDKLAHGG